MNFQKFLCVAMSFAYLGCYFVNGSNLWLSLYGFLFIIIPIQQWFLFGLGKIWYQDFIWRWQTLLIELTYMLNSFCNHIWFNKIHLHPIRNCWASSLAIELKPFMCFCVCVFYKWLLTLWFCKLMQLVQWGAEYRPKWNIGWFEPYGCGAPCFWWVPLLLINCNPIVVYTLVFWNVVWLPFFCDISI